MQTSDAKLTAAELGILWSLYMYDSLQVCMAKYFLATAEDEAIKPVIIYGRDISQTRQKKIGRILSQENIAVPEGLGDGDVNLYAPRLFSDTLMLDYLGNRSGVAMGAIAFAMYASARLDLSRLYREELDNCAKLSLMVGEAQQVKGVLVRAPVVPTGDKVEFAGAPSFFGSLVGESRQLNVLEITHLHMNTQANSLGRKLALAFSQTAETREIREYCRRGAEIAARQVAVFSQVLSRDEIPVPVGWDAGVTNSTVAPFSDKLMLYHMTVMTALGMGNYGLALGASARLDLAAEYTRLMAEILEYAGAGAKLLQKHGWLEEPPQVVDRRELALQR